MWAAAREGVGLVNESARPVMLSFFLAERRLRLYLLHCWMYIQESYVISNVWHKLGT